MRMDFSSVPRLPGWSFQQCIHGGGFPSPSGRLSLPGRSPLQDGVEPEATSHFKKVHPLPVQRQKLLGFAKLSLLYATRIDRNPILERSIEELSLRQGKNISMMV
jgi:hypothetical protein